MLKKTVRDIDVKSKRVLVRCDYNVPQDNEGQITDDRRIRETLPTIKYLMEQGAQIVLTSHLGRPDEKPEEKALYSLKVVADRLSELLEIPVKFYNDCVGEEVKVALQDLADGEVALLENVRYHTAEKKDALAFGRQLVEATGAVYFVLDALNSTSKRWFYMGRPQCIPRLWVFLLKKKSKPLMALWKLLERPFVGMN